MKCVSDATSGKHNATRQKEAGENGAMVSGGGVVWLHGELSVVVVGGRGVGGR